MDKIKGALLSVPRELFVGVIVVLVGTASFGLGRLSSQEIARTPVRILYPEGEGTEVASGGRGVATAAAAAALKPSGAVVASSKGTKYHFSWCPGAKSISEKNKISFESAALAESAGYTLAANCK
ncbi:hypothetical protein K8Q93_03005 [Candidatus Parcubacteria bacterium]|nr:hypothetical protein [Candidatus Parcubacteria bacterium]